MSLRKISKALSQFTQTIALAQTNAQNENLNTEKINRNVARQKITIPSVGTSQGFTATQTYSYDELNRVTFAVETENTQTAWQQKFR